MDQEEGLSQQQELSPAIIDLAQQSREDRAWYEDSPDITIPLFFFGLGLFQFVLRKWILPVRKSTIKELEDQFPTQGLGYDPALGAFLMGLGVLLLIILNVGKWL